MASTLAPPTRSRSTFGCHCAGHAIAEILRHYPTLTSDGVRASAAYGAWLAKQEIRTLTPTP